MPAGTSGENTQRYTFEMVKNMLASFLPTTSADASDNLASTKEEAMVPHEGPELTTEEAWKLYNINRLEASRRYPGDNDRVIESDDEDEDSEENFDPEQEILGAIGGTLFGLEQEMGIDTLHENFRVIHSFGVYDPEDRCEPHAVNVLTRIYSPNRPLYIDVHFDYRCVPGAYVVDWDFRIGFKIYAHPAKDDYYSTPRSKLEQGYSDEAYDFDGWRPLAFAYASFDDKTLRGRGQKNGKEHKAVKLGLGDVQDICDALWGPREALPEDASEEMKIKHRRELVNGVRILLGAVGIQCKIACSDEEEDVYMDYWELGHGKWLARGVRNACGFQLERDPEQAREHDRLCQEYEGEEEECDCDTDDCMCDDDDDGGYGSF